MAASMKMSRLCNFSRQIAKNELFKANLVKNVTYTSVKYFSRSFNNQFNSKRPLLVKTLTISASLGGFAFLAHLLKTSPAVVNAESGERPQHKPIRVIKSDTDSTGLNLTLYQYQTCPFCCKVRAYLDYHGFSYNVVEVNSVRRTELKWTKYPKVPVLVCDGVGQEGYVQLNDSSVIMSVLESLLEDRSKGIETLKSYYPELETKGKRGKTVYEYPNKYFVMYGDKPNLQATPDEMKEERKWRTWVDSWLVHTLSPNVYQSPSQALQAFRYFSEVGEWEKVFSSVERSAILYFGSAAMYLLGKMLKRKYKLKDDVRESLYDACNEWTNALGKNRKFMGGSQPNMADLSVYGVLSSIEGCDAFKDALKNTDISDWFYNTKQLVNSQAGAHPSNTKK